MLLKKGEYRNMMLIYNFLHIWLEMNKVYSKFSLNQLSEPQKDIYASTVTKNCKHQKLR